MSWRAVTSAARFRKSFACVDSACSDSPSASHARFRTRTFSSCVHACVSSSLPSAHFACNSAHAMSASESASRSLAEVSLSRFTSAARAVACSGLASGSSALSARSTYASTAGVGGSGARRTLSIARSALSVARARTASERCVHCDAVARVNATSACSRSLASAGSCVAAIPS